MKPQMKQYKIVRWQGAYRIAILEGRVWIMTTDKVGWREGALLLAVLFLGEDYIEAK